MPPKLKETNVLTKHRSLKISHLAGGKPVGYLQA